METKITESGVEYVEYPVEEGKQKMFISSRPERLKEEGETQEEYKLRRKLNKGSVKRFTKGRAIWNPFILGNTKGLEFNERNRIAVDAYMEKMKKEKEEENEQVNAE